MGFFDWLLGSSNDFTTPSYLHLNAEQMERLHHRRKSEHPKELKRLKQATELYQMDIKETKALGEAQKAELEALQTVGQEHYALKAAEVKTQGAVAHSKKSYRQVKSSYRKVL
jgi:hypothetical protein